MNNTTHIEKINHCIHRALTELADNAELDALHKEFSQLPRRLNEPMQLAIVGRISSAKSSLVNAILGEPEIVRTGSMEETWNVSWLKYGDASSDILVHYKDGHRESVSRSRWATWANRAHSDEHEQPRDHISYIEITYPHDILRSINIIDTPGLDSIYGKDSQNTTDFLAHVRPDAVLMLFTKSIHEDTLGIIKDFRTGIGASVSPINALGVMTKIDHIWASDPSLNPLHKAKEICTRLMQTESVRNTLYAIQPLSPLIAIGSTQLGKRELADLRELSQIDPDTWDDMLDSEMSFTADAPDITLSPSRREALRDMIGRYGISLLVKHLQTAPESSLEQLQQLLREASGFTAFMDTLHAHFHKRATLIKNYSRLHSLMIRCRSLYQQLELESSNPVATAAAVKLRRVIRSLDELIHSLMPQYELVGIMKQIYETKLLVTPDEFDELRRVSGDYGHSCSIRLGLSGIKQHQALIDTALERIEHWRLCYNADADFAPHKTPFYKLIIKLYHELLRDIESAIYQYETSSHFLFSPS